MRHPPSSRRVFAPKRRPSLRVWRAPDATAGPQGCGARHSAEAVFVMRDAARQEDVDQRLRRERSKGQAGDAAYNIDRHLALLRQRRGNGTVAAGTTSQSAAPRWADKRKQRPRDEDAAQIFKPVSTGAACD